MAKKNFVHLHVHSEYSLLDGLTKIKNLIGYVKKLGMNSVALTDHGAMFGAVEFYKECKAQEVKPIIGIEGYIVNGDHRQKTSKDDRQNHHLVLLAKDLTGYKNLMLLSSLAHTEGYYYRPRFSKALLEKYHEGLIALSSCHQGEIGQLLVSGQMGKAKEVASWYQEMMGEGNYYLEIQRHQPGEFATRAVNKAVADRLKQMQKDEDVMGKEVVKLSRELGIPIVATNDVHYLNQSDAVAQDVLVCIGTAKKVADIDRLRYVDMPTLYLRTQEEMQKIFSDLPDALENTVKISQKVNLEIELGRWLFPEIEIPEGKKAPDYLREVAEKNLLDYYPQADQETKKRFNFELDVIIQKGYASYFLMMADLVGWCREHGIATNTRGSAAGSVVTYVLGITTIDPIKYGLPFERFLNPFRPKPPDIDLDIADNRREELIAYIVEKYGSDKVAQICTFGRMLARAAARDVGRVLGHPYAVPDKIAKLVPLGSQGFPMTVKKALGLSPELNELYQSDKDSREILDLAQQIEGNARHASVHAAGIVVSPTKITDYTPLQLEPKGTKIITQYEMHACEDVGLVKFDILGIRNLSILGAAVEIIEKTHGIKIDLSHLPVDDKKTFQMLSRGGTMGTFQLGGSGMTKWLKELKPNRLEDIMVMIALFRPGPMANIPEFIARKQGREKVTYLHPKMRDFLEKSYGILVYQEDVLFTAISLAGYNWETVDKLRLAIGKKIPEEMAKQHEIFVEGAQKNSGLTKKEAEKIWDLFVPFQGYGFNKAHAASYGIVAYQTAYLKAHYPVEFMAALLTAESDYTDKIVSAVEECRRMRIKVLTPDINVSQSGFTIEKDETSLEGKTIRFGLSAIKNVGEAAIETILKARKSEGDFGSLTDFCQRVDTQKVNKKVIESLIKAGALDRFGKRASMLTGLDQCRSKSEKEQKRKSLGQTSFFDDSGEKAEVKSVPRDDFPQVEEFSKKELLAFERALFGFYLSEHPLTESLSLLEQEVSHKLDQIVADARRGERVKVGGILSTIRVVLTKKSGAEMAFGSLEDETGKVDLVIFPSVYAETRILWNVDQIIICEGKVESRDEGVSLIVQKASGLDSLNNNSGLDFTIRIPKGIPSKNLVELNKVLKNNPGKKKGVLVFEGNGFPPKKLVLSFGVDYSSEIAATIKKLLRADS